MFYNTTSVVSSGSWMQNDPLSSSVRAMVTWVFYVVKNKVCWSWYWGMSAQQVRCRVVVLYRCSLWHAWNNTSAHRSLTHNIVWPVPSVISTAPWVGWRLAWQESLQWTRVLARRGNAFANPRYFTRALRAQGCPPLARWHLQDPHSHRWRTQADRGGWPTSSSSYRRPYSSLCGGTTLPGPSTNQ